MYWVVSQWRPLPGREEEWTNRGRAVREAMRQIPGIESAEAFMGENGNAFAIVGYGSKADYERIVKDPNGPFERTIGEHRLEDVAEWISSERGEQLD